MTTRTRNPYPKMIPEKRKPFLKPSVYSKKTLKMLLLRTKPKKNRTVMMKKGMRPIPKGNRRKKPKPNRLRRIRTRTDPRKKHLKIHPRNPRIRRKKPKRIR